MPSITTFGILVPMQPQTPSEPAPPTVEPDPTPASPSNEPSRLVKSGIDIKRWIMDHKRWSILIAAGVVLVLAGGVFAFVMLHHHKPKPVPVVKKVIVPPPAPVAIISPLTGLTVSAAVRAQPIFGVVIENSPEARPQSGLSQAGVVYETLAEGGITRFLAIFLDQEPASLGPVRSLRPYFIDWDQEYSNSPVAHAGGSSQALAEVPQLGFKSMNGLSFGANFHRTGDRAAPHNLYTSTGDLITLMHRLNYTVTATFAPWTYKKPAAQVTPTHPTINLNFSYNLFAAKYQFDPPCDCYDRFLAGSAHIDRNTGQQIKVTNVVAIVVQTSYDSSGHALDTTIGSGKAYVFSDGGATVGTWSKAARNARMQFLDPAGKPVPLNPGNTWIEVLPQTGTVTY